MVTNLDIDSIDVGKIVSETSAAEFEAFPPQGTPDFEYNMVVPESEINAWPSLGHYIKSNPNGILGDLVTELQSRYAGKQIDVDNALYVTMSETTDALDNTPNLAEL
jgi:hypothetical protein